MSLYRDLVAPLHRTNETLKRAITWHLNALDWEALTPTERMTAEELRRQVEEE